MTRQRTLPPTALPVGGMNFDSCRLLSAGMPEDDA
ncbi:hypothetical protein SNOUR_02130 [Streptomyces noursei ATCC 11455]|nr:hypothetical protein SNOUR_02130 [Streptomyces noursei ATCC 11455]